MSDSLGSNLRYPLSLPQKLCVDTTLWHSHKARELGSKCFGSNEKGADNLVANLVANNHITHQGKVFIFEGLDITTKLSTVVVKKFCRKEPNKRRKTCCRRRVA